MAISYLIFPTIEQAKTRSRQGWREALGRDKRHEDGTEFLWDWRVGLDGRTVLFITERRDLLTPAERLASVDTLDPVNWPVGP